jgi:hypothetical protein
LASDLGALLHDAFGAMIFSFTLCPECLDQYAALRHDPAAICSLCPLPLCSLMWADEHPKDGPPNHEPCSLSIIRLAGARTGLWKSGEIPEHSRELWAEAQRMMPNWPGFLRLSLNEAQRDSLEACKEELDEFVGAMAKDFPEMTFTDKGGGVIGLTARRSTHRPMQVMRFSRGSARALALEFHAENVEAFVQELPKAKAALLDWRAKDGTRCEMVLFTVVSASEHHAAIESVIQQICGGKGELDQVLQSLEVRVALFLKDDGQPAKEYIVVKPGQEKAAKAKPWWRFW